MTTIRKLVTDYAKLKASSTRAGYTRRVIVELGHIDIYGWVHPNANFSTTFTLIDDDDGTIVNIEGENANVRDLDD